MENIKLRLPLRSTQVTQDFGKNYLNFYRNMGLLGHNGVDFRAMDGFNCYASHDGIVAFAGENRADYNPITKKYAVEVELFDPVQKIKTIYYHHRDVTVKVGQKVKAGDLIAHCDNTGSMTTGDHLHYGLKQTDNNGNTINYNNGYKGAIDPGPYFCLSFNGVEIGAKDCYKSNAYHRYFRGRPKGGLENEKKVLKALITKLKRMPTAEEINACTYGGWDWEAVDNPIMYELWAFLTKNQFINEKVSPFQD